MGVPSTKTEKDAVDMQLLMISQKGRESPVVSSVAMIAFHLTATCFFEDNVQAALLGVLILQCPWTISSAMIVLSLMCLPCTKAVWCRDRSSGMTFDILSANILVRGL